jgi:hypothetical protein
VGGWWWWWRMRRVCTVQHFPACASGVAGEDPVLPVGLLSFQLRTPPQHRRSLTACVRPPIPRSQRLARPASVQLGVHTFRGEATPLRRRHLVAYTRQRNPALPPARHAHAAPECTFESCCDLSARPRPHGRRRAIVRARSSVSDEGCAIAHPDSTHGNAAQPTGKAACHRLRSDPWPLARASRTHSRGQSPPVTCEPNRTKRWPRWRCRVKSNEPAGEQGCAGFVPRRELSYKVLRVPCGNDLRRG